MCDCIDPPKGKQPAPPTPENISEYRATYGEMVKVEYVSQFAPVSPVTFYGPATRVNYGYRAKGDIFYVWEADVINSDGVFQRVEVFEAPKAARTVVPEPPKVVDPSEADTQPSEPVDSSDDPLDGMTKKQLKAYAEERGIDLGRANTVDTLKAAIRAVPQ